VKVLLTGAAGGVAGQLRDGLAGLPLRVTDVRPVDEWYTPGGWDALTDPAAEAVSGDLADRDFAASVLAGVDAVVHLAANPSPGAEWPDLRRPNTDAVVTLLETARDLGVRRVVLAGSVHAVGGYVLAGERPVDPTWPAAPCCEYGVTKVFAEAMGRYVADHSEMSVVCLRLGACLPAPPSLAELAGWLASADLRRLVRAAVTADVRYGVYFGVSANTPPGFDLTNARRELGYQPVLDGSDYRGDLPDGDLTFGHRR
jgi:nucleoside-diphosphate-sugar epimerase